GLVETVGLHGGQASRLEGVALEGQLDGGDLRRVEQALDVGAQAEDGAATIAALVAAHPLEDAQAVVEREGDEVGLTVGEGDQLAVAPDPVGGDHVWPRSRRISSSMSDRPGFRRRATSNSEMACSG